MRVARPLPHTVALLTAAAVVQISTPAGAAVDLGVGAMGSAGANFLDKPDRKQFDPDVYPGFSGAAFGGGLFADVRFAKILGVEVAAISSSDHGKGTVTFNGYDFKVTIGQSAWHVPVLAKLTLDAPLVAPAFFIGPEFVFPGDPEVEIAGPYGVTLPARGRASSYTMLTFGGGIEIKLPLPVIDLRLPIQLRLSYNPGVPSAFADRVEARGGTFYYDTEWKYAVALTAGAGIWF